MLSIICVYNDEAFLNINLKKSLNEQDIKYELILVNNTKGQFNCLTKAMNYGGKQANKDFLMFVHQDVELLGTNWLRNAEKFLNSMSNVGIVGVSGVDEYGNPIGFIIDRGRYWGSPIKKPEQIKTLDELLIIVPKKVFHKIRLDENFKWHSWATDYCLKIRSIGLKAYVLPLKISHNSSTLPILNVTKLEQDDLKLWLKHRNNYSTIYKTTSLYKPIDFTIKSRFEKYNLIKILINSRLDVFKKKYMNNTNKRALDVIIPIEQPFFLKNKLNINQNVGISDKEAYLLASKRINAHNCYIHTSIYDLPFRKKIFDTIHLNSVLEYLTKEKGKLILNSLDEIVKEIIIQIPNNGFPMSKAYKVYKSIWKINDLKNKGYKVHGLTQKFILRNKILKLFNPIIQFVSWWIPQISGIIIAIKK